MLKLPIIQLSDFGAYFVSIQTDLNINRESVRLAEAPDKKAFKPISPTIETK